MNKIYYTANGIIYIMHSYGIKIIKLNKIKCKKCGSILESKDINDFKRCSCGAVAIDGGYEYLKRIGNISDYEELSKYVISNIQGEK